MDGDAKGPSARLLTLLSLLESGRPRSGGELAVRLAASPRTVRRDIDRLRVLGYQVESTRGTGGGYRLLGGEDMPPLPLSQDEAVAIAVGLRHAAAHEGTTAGPASSALNRIERLLPARVRRRFESVLATTESEPRGGQSAEPAVMSELAAAARLCSQVRFDYTAVSGRESSRRVEPHRQELFAHRWYLRAWDLDRADWRSFRVDRIRRVVVPGTTFTPRPLPRGPASFPPRVEPAATDTSRDGPVGSVLFLAAPVTVAPRLAAQAGVLEAVAADRCRYTTPPDDWHWLSGILAAVDVPYLIEGPPELAQANRRLAERVGGTTETNGVSQHTTTYADKEGSKGK